jgi:hypothetical protein
MRFKCDFCVAGYSNRHVPAGRTTQNLVFTKATDFYMKDERSMTGAKNVMTVACPRRKTSRDGMALRDESISKRAVGSIWPT